MTAGLRALDDLPGFTDLPQLTRDLAALLDATRHDDHGPELDKVRARLERVRLEPVLVRRLPLRPGDALAITLPFTTLTVDEQRAIRDHVRRELCMPALPVLVFPAGTALAVLSSDEEPT